MTRFIDIILGQLDETTDPFDGISYAPTEIPITKEVAKSDTVTTTRFSHISQQKEKLMSEIKAGIDAVQKHIQDNNFKLARLALESLESLEEEIRGLELEEAGVHDKTTGKGATE